MWSWDQLEEGHQAAQQNYFTIFGFESGDTNGNEEGEGFNTPQHTDTANDSVYSTPESPSLEAISTSVLTQGSDIFRGDNSAVSSEPQHLRSLDDIYNNTEIVELEDELLLAGMDEPLNYDQAPRKKEWRSAMKAELEAVERNRTWTLTELPPGKKTIDLKWVFKLKKDLNGEIVKHKARIVAKGYVQEYGIDFEEIFTPVTRLETVRLILALSAKNGWGVHHLDVKSAFLNGELTEEVYVSQPEGFVQPGQEHMVYKLHKALYGLRQAPRAWYSKLSKCLESMALTRCPYEHVVYTKKEEGEVLIVAVYVDDLLVTGTNAAVIRKFKDKMSESFDMSDLGTLSYYL